MAKTNMDTDMTWQNYRICGSR